MSNNLQELLRTMVVGLVENPDEIRIDERQEEEDKTVLELRVAQEDIGRVIGRQGRIIKAIRVIIKAASADPVKRVFVDVIDENAAPKEEVVAE